MKHGMWAVPVLHPALTFRLPDQLGPLEAHVTGFVFRHLHGFPRTVVVEREPSVSRLMWLVKECKRLGKALGVDVEAAPPPIGNPAWALLPGYARLRAIGVGADIGNGIGMSWYFPVAGAVWRVYRAAMADPKLAKVFTNGWSYDIPLLKRYGAHFAGPIHDLRDCRRALVSTSRTGLGPQAAMYLRVPPWKVEAVEDDSDEKGYIDPSRIKREKLLEYNAKDCIYTAQIRTHHVREMREVPADRPRIERLYKQQLRLAQASARMAYNGFPVDEKKRKALSRELLRLSAERAVELRKLLRPHLASRNAFRITDGGVNENDLAALIYRESAKKGIRGFELEVPMTDKCRTDGGKPAVNRNALLFLFIQDNCPDELKRIIRLAWQVDAPLKARSTFVESDKVLSRIGPDGRIHPSYNSCGTETGRWSCSKPNLFNLSETKSEDEGALQGDLPNIRDMYVAPPGHVIIHRDFKQLELEVMADYTGDALLRAMLNTGDAHTARVYEWFGVPRDAPVPKMLRRQGKVVGFASQYSAGIETVLIKVLEQVPDAKFEDVAALHGLFSEKHIGIKAHWERSRDFAEMHGFNETPIMQRRRYYPPGFPLKPTETSNYAIQGGAADIANCTMVGIEEADYPGSLLGKLERYFPRAWLAMHTYDSFDIIAPEKDAEAIDRLTDESMTGPWKIGAAPRNFPSDGKVGKRWGDV